MDTKDKDFELASPGVMQPDSSMSPLLIENETQTLNGYAAPGVEAGDGQVILPDQKPKKAPTPLQESLRRLRRDKRAMVSLGVIILFILIPILGPTIYQHIGASYNSTFSGKIGPSLYHNPFHGELDREDELFSGQYWLGTDSIGRDLLARLMQGMLVSIMVALLVEIVDITLGVTVGVLAGFFGGWIDQLLARFTDIMFAFPGLLFAILLTGIFGTTADTAFANIPLIGANGNARLISGLDGPGIHRLAFDGALCARANAATQRTTIRRSGPHFRYQQL